MNFVTETRNPLDRIRFRGSFLPCVCVYVCICVVFLLRRLFSPLLCCYALFWHVRGAGPAGAGFRAYGPELAHLG